LLRGGKTIALDRSVRVYELPEWVEGVRTKGEGTYACLLKRGSTLALQPTRRGRTFGLAAAREHFELAGTMVAFVEAQRGVDTACFSIGVIDVESGPRVLLSTDVGCSIDGGFVKSEYPADLVVNEHGSVAWIVTKSGFGHRRRPSKFIARPLPRLRRFSTRDRALCLDRSE
jgi:hypothetical protein